MIDGDGFKAGATRTEPTSLIDIAPTILAYLGQAADSLQGKALQSQTDGKSVDAQYHHQELDHVDQIQ